MPAREKASDRLGTVALLITIFTATPALALQIDLASLPVPAFGTTAIIAAVGLMLCLVVGFALGAVFENMWDRPAYFIVFSSCACYFIVLGLLPDAAYAKLLSLLGS